MAHQRYDPPLLYTLPEQDALFRYAHAHDVERGGRYDARVGAINVWSHPWTEPCMRDESTIMGTWYFLWWPTRLYLIQSDPSFDLADLLDELALLEQEALGRVKHGRPHDDRLR